MARKLLQNKIAESRFALPVTALYGLLICFASGIFELNNWIQLGILGVSSYLMAELNNAHSLIRVYSRMVSCSYIMLFLMTGLLTFEISVCFVQLCIIVFYLCLFRAYQDKGAVGIVFYAFMFLGIASILFIQILYFVPLAWILLRTNILACNIRTFCASVFGLLFPYWIVGGYYLYIGNIGWLIGHLEHITCFPAFFDYSVIDKMQIIMYAVLVILAFTGIVHLNRNSYKDKIRTRMFFEIFMIVDFITIVFLALQPVYYDFLIGIIVVNTAPLIAHFMALSGTKITNISFFVIMIAVMALTLCNIWMPS